MYKEILNQLLDGEIVIALGSVEFTTHGYEYQNECLPEVDEETDDTITDIIHDRLMVLCGHQLPEPIGYAAVLERKDDDFVLVELVSGLDDDN